MGDWNLQDWKMVDWNLVDWKGTISCTLTLFQKHEEQEG